MCEDKMYGICYIWTRTYVYIYIYKERKEIDLKQNILTASSYPRTQIPAYSYKNIAELNLVLRVKCITCIM
jgi:hypothetical protein